MTDTSPRSFKAQFFCSCLMIIVLCFNGCSSAYLPPVPGLSRPSEDEETRISREFRREAKKHFKFVTNPEVERYTDRIGQRILSAMGPQPFDYRFFMVEDTQLNAFAVPGGSIYLYTGLLEKAKSSAEVAGVLSHEIVHVKGRHMVRSTGPDALSILALLGMLAARGGSGAQAAGTIGQAISATRQIAYARQLELEADTLGARYMSAAGYDPKGALAFLKLLDQERALNPIDIPAYMMTHPVTQERVANMELVIRSLGKVEARSEEPDPIKKIQIIIRFERRGGDAVVQEYQKLLDQDAQNPELLHLLAFAQQLGGRLPQAQQNYEKARKINPNSAALNRDLGRLYTRLENYSSAREVFERALALEPKEPLNYLYLGELYEQENDLRAAAGAYLNAHNFSPLWDKPPYRLSVLYGKLNRLGDAYYYLARSLLLQDEDEKAMADLEKAIKAAGENSPRGQAIKEELKSLRARRR